MMAGVTYGTIGQRSQRVSITVLDKFVMTRSKSEIGQLKVIENSLFQIMIS